MGSGAKTHCYRTYRYPFTAINKPLNSSPYLVYTSFKEPGKTLQALLGGESKKHALEIITTNSQKVLENKINAYKEFLSYIAMLVQ